MPPPPNGTACDILNDRACVGIVRYDIAGHGDCTATLLIPGCALWIVMAASHNPWGPGMTAAHCLCTSLLPVFDRHLLLREIS